MTFDKPRFSKGYDWELVRYAGTSSFSIQGGASKLLKHFQTIYPNQSIVTYADRRWSEGNLYKKLGFVLSHISLPNYFYVNSGKVRSRYQCQKRMLKTFLVNFDESLSEEQNMVNNGWEKIYDCGNMVFSLKPSFVPL